jgi:hypothetical protein
LLTWPKTSYVLLSSFASSYKLSFWSLVLFESIWLLFPQNP